MVDVFHYFKKVITGLRETTFGVILPSDVGFVKFMERHPEFSFERGRDFYEEEDYCNLWESEVDGFTIVRVCCNAWVITFKNNEVTEESLTRLIELERKLNERGYMCRIGISNKTCSCT